MKKGMPWASPSLDALVFLKYIGEIQGNLPKLKLFTLLDLFYYPPLLILENFLHTKSFINFIRGLSTHKFKSTLVLVETHFQNSIKHQLQLLSLFVALHVREPRIKPAKRQCKKQRQNLSKTEQPVKMNFFEALPLLKSENDRLMKDAYIYQEYAQTIADVFDCS